MFILDTNICIYLMKNTYPQLTEKLLSMDPADICISAITVYELEYGAAKSNWGEKTRLKLAQFFAPFTILPFTTEHAITAGKIRAYLVQQGTPIGPYDIQMAAQGVSENMTVITHNKDEFMRVPGIMLEDWTI